MKQGGFFSSHQALGKYFVMGCYRFVWASRWASATLLAFSEDPKTRVQWDEILSQGAFSKSFDIFLPKLFWPTMRKNCSCDREKLLKFETEGQEFAKILQTLGLQPKISKVFLDHKNNFFLTVGQNNFGNKISNDFENAPWERISSHCTLVLGSQC